jgi:hypothetical protein
MMGISSRHVNLRGPATLGKPSGASGAHPRFIDLQRRLEAAGPWGSDGKGGILPPLFVKMDSGSMKRGCARASVRFAFELAQMPRSPHDPVRFVNGYSLEEGMI